MADTPHTQSSPFVPPQTAALVRYQVREIERAIAFYTQHLGFRSHSAPARSSPRSVAATFICS